MAITTQIERFPCNVTCWDSQRTPEDDTIFAGSQRRAADHAPGIRPVSYR